MKPVIVRLNDDTVGNLIFEALIKTKLPQYDLEIVCFENDSDAYNFIRTNSHRIFVFLQDSNRPDGGLYDSITNGNLNIARQLYSGYLINIDLFFNYIADALAPEAGQIYNGAGFNSDTEENAIRRWAALDARVDRASIGDERLGRLIEFHLQRWLLLHEDNENEFVNQFYPLNEELRLLCSHKPNYLEGLSSRGFEKLIAAILKNHGFQVELTAATKDGGYDIKAVINTKSKEQITLVEVKRYSPFNKVSVGVIRSLYGVCKLNNANKGMLVTSSHVSNFAKCEFAKTIPLELEIVERNKVLEWCSSYLKSILNPVNKKPTVEKYNRY